MERLIRAIEAVGAERVTMKNLTLWGRLDHVENRTGHVAATQLETLSVMAYIKHDAATTTVIWHYANEEDATRFVVNEHGILATCTFMNKALKNTFEIRSYNGTPKHVQAHVGDVIELKVRIVYYPMMGPDCPHGIARLHCKKIGGDLVVHTVMIELNTEMLEASLINAQS